MLRAWVLLVMVLPACKDDSGTARKVAPAPVKKERAPEPPGGPPSCDDVGTHLGAALDVPSEMHAKVGGADVPVSGDDMRAAMEGALVEACREAAWSHDTRLCAMSWNGNILRERAKLAEACPGTVKQ